MNKEEAIECPECGSMNIFDFDGKYECEDCGYRWQFIEETKG